MEKIIKKRLVSYLNKLNIVSKNQYGFKPGVSTEDAIAELLEIIIKNFNNKKKTLTTFLDLAKAFDTVSQSRLIDTWNT
jgi:retron-type reverse transcriptase